MQNWKAQARADQKFGARVETLFGLALGEHRACAYEHSIAKFGVDLADHFDRARDRHGNFHDRDAAIFHGFGREDCFGGAGGADYRDDAYFVNGVQRFLSVHLYFVREVKSARAFCCFYREIRALWPFIMAKTSCAVAIEVSPGVVIASAPCATPHSTAQAISRPSRSP